MRLTLGGSQSMTSVTPRRSIPGRIRSTPGPWSTIQPTLACTSTMEDRGAVASPRRGLDRHPLGATVEDEIDFRPVRRAPVVRLRIRDVQLLAAQPVLAWSSQGAGRSSRSAGYSSPVRK